MHHAALGQDGSGALRKAVLLGLLLAGCAHKEPAVEIREVPVITPISCVDPAEIPAEPPRVRQRFNGDARHDLEILAENAQALRQWGQDMRVLLDRCVVQTPGEGATETQVAPVIPRH